MILINVCVFRTEIPRDEYARPVYPISILNDFR